MTFVPFANADTIGDRFLALLSKLGIQPPVGSSLEDELLSLTQLIEIMKNPDIIGSDQPDTALRAAAGVHDFAAKLLSVEPISEFNTFEPHLRLIAESKIKTASFSQNAGSAYNDDTGRKMAELYFGCLAAHVGTQVDLDHPTNAKGDNPDVIFTIEESNGKKPPERWALAIKTISSKNGQTIYERIKEGAAQIDDPKCSADRGMVVINTKNALDHEALWMTEFSDLDSAMTALRNQLCGLAEKAGADRDQAEWDEMFIRKVARPVLFLGQSLVCVPTPAGQRTPTALKMLLEYGANGELDPVAHSISECMNHFMQTILLGQPGGNGSLPT
ncbi:hypothetical protein ACOJCM_10105 [Billgrantia sp. LNSP4103-1]|uniref:hypothetical protein n=1 Tax=Billgrantia sp. LNSP4103-1 TaxID=3410266 RepID=UPI00403F2F0A